MIRRRVRLTDGWLFHRGELDPRPARGTSKAGGCGGITDLAYDEISADHAQRERAAIEQTKKILPGIEQVSGEYPRAETLGSGWRPVRVPHDWRVEIPPSPSGPLFQAFAPGGVAYYRRRFALDAYEPSARTFIEFDGVMRDSTVWCNGFLVGNHLSGYSGFRYDVTEVLRYGDEGENILLVRCDATNGEGWWYEGAGIYRSVWMTTTSAVHVDFDGVFVTTPTVSPNEATVRVATTVRNDGPDAAAIEIVTSVVDPDGVKVADASQTLDVEPDASATSQIDVLVATPRLWNVGDAQLYALTTEIRRDGERIDRVETPFGIRIVEFRGDQGLFVNGERVQLKGANLHQDFAGVGVALPDRVIAHKLELIAEMSCNAVRSAHNPSSPVFLDAADRLGLLVIAENRMLSSAPPFLGDLESLVRGGRNHPSVLLWSLENEESIQGSAMGTRILERLIRTVCRLDPTRAVSVGGHHNFENEYFDRLDVVSTHYQSLRRSIGDVLQLRPTTPHMAGEEGLFPTVRGQYTDDVDRGLPSAFGTGMGLFAYMSRLESGSYDHGQTWQWFADHPEVSGGFVWTGIDYFGEPTPMRWPVTVSTYGAIDICGFPKDYYWLLRSFFRAEPLVHALPHWTWPGREGDRVRMWVYTNCDEVSLEVNGSIIDRQKPLNNVARWDDGVVYEPGTMTVRGWRDGAVVAEQVNETAGEPASIACTVQPETIAGDGHDVALVSVSIVDGEGRLCPWASHDVLFMVDGPGEVIGVGNGDPTSLESHRAPRRRAFRGRCLAIVQSLPDAEGAVSVRASADGLRTAEATFEVARNVSSAP